MTLRRYIPGVVLLMLVWTINIAAQEVGGIGEEEPNLTAEENLEPGTTDWQIPKGHEAYDRQIEGYASKPSVNIGEPIQFYVNVKNSLPFRIDIYRMGYYG
jgi:hypothetical protein